MNLSAKKHGEIYDIVHEVIRDLRLKLLEHYTVDYPNKRRVDYEIAQIEIPLAQKIIKLLKNEQHDKT